MARRRFRHQGSQALRLQGAQARNLGPGASYLFVCSIKSCPSQPRPVQSYKIALYNCNDHENSLFIGHHNKYFVSTRPITANWPISHIFSTYKEGLPPQLPTSADADPCSHFEGSLALMTLSPQNWLLRRVYSLLLTHLHLL